MEENLMDLVRGCSSAFQTVISGMPGLERDVERDIKEILGKYKIWCYEAGIVDTDSSTLEDRLRESSDIRQLVAKLLGDLRLTLLQFTTGGNDECSTVEQLNTNAPTNQLVRTTRQLMANLSEVSILIEQPAPIDRITAIRKVRSMHTSPFATPLSHPAKVNITETLFPHAPKPIRDRLQQAANARVCYLADVQRLRRMWPVRKYPEGLVWEQSTSQQRSRALDVLVLAGLWNVDTESRLELQARRSSHRLAALRTGMYFLCPYCGIMTELKDSTLLRGHVLHDLSPYVCVNSSCHTPTRTWSQRAEWYEHYRQHREQELRPPVGSSTSESLRSVVCELCQTHVLEGMEEHLGKHLEEFAILELCHSQSHNSTIPNLSERSGQRAVSSRGSRDVAAPTTQPGEESSSDSDFVHTPGILSESPMKGKQRVMFCCECGDGPNLMANIVACPNCYHRTCPRCKKFFM